MTRTLKSALACAIVAASVGTASQAFAQVAPLQHLNNAGQQPKKPQYVPQAKQQEKIFPLGSTWTAVSLNGKAFNGNDRPSFIIDSQYRARGYGGCNTFAATAFPLREQHLAVGPLAITKKTCDKSVGASEQAYFMALRTAGQWDMVGSQLVIRSPSGELRFDRSL